MESLAQVRIVMVNTTHPGNIGAAARAMRNMGLSDLALVGPKIFPSDEATARAAGAVDILERAKIHASLADAIADRVLVIGASARRRAIAWPELDPRAAAGLTLAQSVPTAILFGREHSGLTNEEMELCHYLLHIPCDPEFSSLNVSAAIQVVAYELRMAALAGSKADESARHLASAEQMAGFYEHLEETLFGIRFLHEKKAAPSLMRRIKRIFNRASLEQEEIHLLRGILSAALSTRFPRDN